MSRPVAFSRRSLVKGAAAAALATPFIWRRARAAQQLIVRTTGGVYNDVMRKAVYDPFTRETGIEVVAVGAPMSKLLAMYKAGGSEYDVLDAGDSTLLVLNRMGALAELDYKSWKYTDIADIAPQFVQPTRVAFSMYGTVIAYNTKTFPKRHPTTWTEFWDTKAFPGPRGMPDMATGWPPLEFALLADGVPMDKLYPMDLDRAFRSMDRIRQSVPKFWDSGALCAEQLSDEEVVLSCAWNGRVQTLMDKGAPLGIEWNQNMFITEAYGIPKSTRDMKAAQLFVDFACQPKAQLGYSQEMHYTPINLKAFDLMPKSLVDTLPGGPAYRQLGFFPDYEWYESNRDRINKAWSAWILG
jgi:putative spermidine/putrescine transport system substrate-binding protein